MDALPRISEVDRDEEADFKGAERPVEGVGADEGPAAGCAAFPDFPTSNARVSAGLRVGLVGCSV